MVEQSKNIQLMAIKDTKKCGDILKLNNWLLELQNKHVTLLDPTKKLSEYSVMHYTEHCSRVWCWQVAPALWGKIRFAGGQEIDHWGTLHGPHFHTGLLLADGANCSQPLFFVGDYLSSYLENALWFMLIFTADFPYD